MLNIKDLMSKAATLGQSGNSAIVQTEMTEEPELIEPEGIYGWTKYGAEGAEVHYQALVELHADDQKWYAVQAVAKEDPQVDEDPYELVTVPAVGAVKQICERGITNGAIPSPDVKGGKLYLDPISPELYGLQLRPKVKGVPKGESAVARANNRFARFAERRSRRDQRNSAGYAPGQTQ